MTADTKVSLWPLVPIKRFAKFVYGDALPVDRRGDGGSVPVFGSNGAFGCHTAANTGSPVLLIGRKGSVGAINWSDDPTFAIDTVYYVDNDNCQCELRWLYWALQISGLENLSQDTGVPGLSREIAYSVKIPLPLQAEQRVIATFLDRETAKIDALVEEQKRLIELLKEKRQAVISHAVTKGLNPNARMKDSGIEWLGEVPEHWEVRPLKYVTKLQSGGTPSKANLRYWNGTLPWASAKDLKTDRLSDTFDHITELAISEGAAALIPAGAVIILVRGMMLARAFPVCIADVSMAINQDLKAVQGIRIDNEFLAWALRGLEKETLSRLDEAGHGTKALRMEAWRSMEIPLPPLHEQREITCHLRHTTETIDVLVEDIEKAIGLLHERRTSLVSAVVTGKFDVSADTACVEAA